MGLFKKKIIIIFVFVSNSLYAEQLVQEHSTEVKTEVKADEKVELKSEQISDTNSGILIETNPLQHQSNWIFSIGPSFAFGKIESEQKTNNSEARYLSEPNLGLNFESFYIWPNKNNSGLVVKILSNNFDSEVDEKKLKSVPDFIWSVGLSHQFRSVFKDIHFSTYLSTGNDFFEQAVSSSELKFSETLITNLAGQITYDIFKFSRHEISTQLDLIYSFAKNDSKFDVEEAKGFKIAILENYKLNDVDDKKSILVRLYYELLEQETTFLSRDKASLGFDMLYVWGVK